MKLTVSPWSISIVCNCTHLIQILLPKRLSLFNFILPIISCPTECNKVTYVTLSLFFQKNSELILYQNYLLWVLFVLELNQMIYLAVLTHWRVSWLVFTRNWWIWCCLLLIGILQIIPCTEWCSDFIGHILISYWLLVYAYVSHQQRVFDIFPLCCLYIIRKKMNDFVWMDGWMDVQRMDGVQSFYLLMLDFLSINPPILSFLTHICSWS